MSKSFSLMMFLLIVFVPNVEAETVLLKNGTVIDSPILEQNKERIKIEVNGVPITYYADAIRSIDGIEPLEFLSSVDVPLEEDLPQSVTDDEEEISKPKTKTELILAFIDAFGTRESLIKNFEDLIKTAPPKQSEEIKKAINIDELINQLIPLYDKNFTEDDLKEYIDFYSSPEGKKLIETTPILMQESVAVSLKYLKEKLPNVFSAEIK